MARILLGIVGLIIILIIGGQVLPGVVDQTSSEAYAENFATTTGVNVTTATETLSYDSYYDDLTGLSASSDNSEDHPAVLAYDPDTDEVTIDQRGCWTRVQQEQVRSTSGESNGRVA